MLTQIPPIARTTFIESVRQPVYFVLVMLGGLGILMVTWSTGFSLGYTEDGEVSGDDKLLLDVGMATVFLVGTLLAGFIATSAVSREIENKTVLTVVSKPVPRAAVVLGKYVGVASAIAVAVVITQLFLLLAVQHGVQTAVWNKLDLPVIVFTFSALGLAMGAGVWGNFFYGWNFTQTTTLTLLPLIALAYALSLLFDKQWALHPIAKDIKPLTSAAQGVLLLGIMVMTAIAVAASTRLGQVMTIVVCFGVLVLGMASSALVGRYAFDNRPIGQVLTAESLSSGGVGFQSPGAEYRLTLDGAPSRVIRPGLAIYYGPNPNGFNMPVPPFADPADEPGAPGGSGPAAGAGTGPAGGPAAEPVGGAIVAVEYDADAFALRIRHEGPPAVAIARPPMAKDFVFDRATAVNPAALIVWGLVPNLQFFWLLDAVNQNHAPPAGHYALIALYSLTQTAMALALAVLLFQGRDVG
ncbi:MAG: hypothetical protein C0513_05935 [Isosphaera sp.]|nr:hypothetical protein [Isosphaera sp.]